MVPQTKYPLLCSLLLSWVFFSITASGQKRIFEGGYQVDKYDGLAQFEYRMAEGDTVLDGSFLMKQAAAEELYSTGDRYFYFSGFFKDNLPQGAWEFLFGDFKEGESTEFTDNQYHIRVDGVKQSSNGRLINGKPEGEWVHLAQSLENSEVDALLFKSTFDFKDGVPQKSFRIENEKMSLIGRFLRDGHAHDVWELYGEDSPDAIEKWYFTDGRLNRIILGINDEVDTLRFYESEITTPQVINLDKRFIDLLRLKQLIHKRSNRLASSRMNGLLVENAGYYKKIDDILSNLGESTFMPEFKVKVPHYPLGDDEIRSLGAIQDYLKRSEAISNRVLSSAPVQILKFSDESVLLLVSAIETINQSYNLPLQQLLGYYENEVLQFVRRDSVIDNLWRDANRTTSFTVSYESTEGAKNVSMQGPNSGSYSFDDNVLADMERMGAYAFFSIDSIHHEIQKKLTLEQRQEELEALEGLLVDQMTALNELIDSLHSVVDHPAKGMLSAIKSNAGEKLKDYSGIQDMDQRNDRVIELTECFGKMGELSAVVAKLPTQQSEIKELYTERVWNPFTATLMDEEQKKRIKSAYDLVLIPYLVEEVEADFSCDRTLELRDLLETTHQQMQALWESETKTLERRIKRENDPLEVLNLFTIHLSENEN